MVLNEDGSNLEEFTNSMPEELQSTFLKLQEDSLNGFSYTQLRDYLKIFERFGYTFDYSLDAEPYDFMKIPNK